MAVSLLKINLFIQKSFPMILSCLGLQLLVLQPTITKSDEEAPSLKSLISDPYILIAAGRQFKIIISKVMSL